MVREAMIVRLYFQFYEGFWYISLICQFADSIDDSAGSNSKSSSRTKYSHSRESSDANIIQIGSLQTSFDEISKATSNFSSANKIGEGAFGTVYRGKLRDGSLVAIKRAKTVSRIELPEKVNFGGSFPMNLQCNMENLAGKV